MSRLLSSSIFLITVLPVLCYCGAWDSDSTAEYNFGNSSTLPTPPSTIDSYVNDWVKRVFKPMETGTPHDSFLFSLDVDQRKPGKEYDGDNKYYERYMRQINATDLNTAGTLENHAETEKSRKLTPFFYDLEKDQEFYHQSAFSEDDQAPEDKGAFYEEYPDDKVDLAWGSNETDSNADDQRKSFNGPVKSRRKNPPQYFYDPEAVLRLKPFMNPPIYESMDSLEYKAAKSLEYDVEEEMEECRNEVEEGGDANDDHFYERLSEKVNNLLSSSRLAKNGNSIWKLTKSSSLNGMKAPLAEHASKNPEELTHGTTKERKLFKKATTTLSKNYENRKFDEILMRKIISDSFTKKVGTKDQVPNNDRKSNEKDEIGLEERSKRAAIKKKRVTRKPTTTELYEYEGVEEKVNEGNVSMPTDPNASDEWERPSNYRKLPSFRPEAGKPFMYPPEESVEYEVEEEDERMVREEAAEAEKRYKEVMAEEEKLSKLLKKDKATEKFTKQRAAIKKKRVTRKPTTTELYEYEYEENEGVEEEMNGGNVAMPTDRNASDEWERPSNYRKLPSFRPEAGKPLFYPPEESVVEEGDDRMVREEAAEAEKRYKEVMAKEEKLSKLLKKDKAMEELTTQNSFNESEEYEEEEEADIGITLEQTNQHTKVFERNKATDKNKASTLKTHAYTEEIRMLPPFFYDPEVHLPEVGKEFFYPGAFPVEAEAPKKEIAFYGQNPDDKLKVDLFHPKPDYIGFQNFNKCRLPAPHKTWDVVVTILRTKLTARFYCSKGFTFPEGKVRKNTCDMRIGRWDKEFEGCQEIHPFTSASTNE